MARIPNLGGFWTHRLLCGGSINLLVIERNWLFLSVYRKLVSSVRESYKCLQFWLQAHHCSVYWRPSAQHLVPEH